MAHRTFTDSAGRYWEVWTVHPANVERRRDESDEALTLRVERERRRERQYRVKLGTDWANGWLAFQTGDEKRRLTPIPGGWESASDRELEALCESAVPAQPPRRLAE